jgi:ubiquinone biosynthesis protein
MDLAELQDRMSTFPRKSRSLRSRNRSAARSTTSFGDFGEPIAAASIAQVHPAEVERDGVRTKVAVKAIRPGVRRRFFNDLESYFLAARLQERFMPSSRG